MEQQNEICASHDLSPIFEAASGWYDSQRLEKRPRARCLVKDSEKQVTKLYS